MAKNFDYITEVKLKNNEAPAKINLETGEVKQITKKRNNIPKGKEVFETNAIFKKDYSNSWMFLKRTLSHLEISTAMGLSLLAKAHTNSLEPISNETGARELSDLLDVSVNKVKLVLKKLLDLGVYGKFEVVIPEKPYSKFWILNPYLSFNGKLVDSDIARLFIGTHIEKAFNNPEYKIPKKIPKKIKMKEIEVSQFRDDNVTDM